MAADVKLEINIVEYDEQGNRIHSYGDSNITRIAAADNWVAVYIESQHQIFTFRKGIYRGSFNIPNQEVATIKMSGVTVIVEFTNGQELGYEEIKQERIWKQAKI
jgi:hypothetical protein